MISENASAARSHVPKEEAPAPPMADARTDVTMVDIACLEEHHLAHPSLCVMLSGANPPGCAAIVEGFGD